MDLEIIDALITRLDTISLFIQLLFYAFFVLCLIYFGYWFFSRFFY